MPKPPRLRLRRRLAGEPALWLTLCLCASARLLARVFEDAPFKVPGHYWQLLDAEWLQQDPLQSIYLMHMQPPLLNAVYAVSLAMPGGTGTLLLQALFLCCSATTVSMVYFFLRRIGLRQITAGAAAFLFGVLPQVLTYENFFFYPHLEATVLLCAMFFAGKYLEDLRLASFVSFAACLVTLASLHSLFHISWIAIALFSIWGMASYRHGRQTQALVIAVVAISVTATIYTKNLKEFGTFSASSWQGVNLARMVLLSPEEVPIHPNIAHDLKARASRGEFSEWMRTAIEAPNIYEGWLAFARDCEEDNEKFAALCVITRPNGTLNFNNMAMVKYSQALGREAFKLLRLYPQVYLGHVIWSVRNFLATPSWEHPTIEVPFKAYADLWSELLLYHDNPSAYRNELMQAPNQFGFLHCLLVLAGLTILFVNGTIDLVGYCRKGQATADWIFPLLAVVLFLVGPNLINGVEAQRIRYSIEPMLFLALVLGASRRAAVLAIRNPARQDRGTYPGAPGP
jgi:hypothetical protein